MDKCHDKHACGCCTVHNSINADPVILCLTTMAYKMMKMPHLTTYKGKYAGAKEHTSLLNGNSDSVVKD